MRRIYDKLKALGVKKLGKVNYCLLEGIRLGHISLVANGLDTEIFRAQCCNCEVVLPCTVRNALYQSHRGVSEEYSDDVWDEPKAKGCLKCKSE
jgi:hypothetical protein